MKTEIVTRTTTYMVEKDDGKYVIQKIENKAFDTTLYTINNLNNEDITDTKVGKKLIEEFKESKNGV